MGADDLPTRQARYDQAVAAHRKAMLLTMATESLEKLQLLRDDYGLSDVEDPWLVLCLRLAEEHVPGFAVAFPATRGRKQEWGEGRLLRLYVDARQADRGHGDLDTCRLLVRGVPYKGLKAESLRDRLVEARKSTFVLAGISWESHGVTGVWEGLSEVANHLLSRPETPSGK